MCEKTDITEVMDAFHVYGMAASENEIEERGYEGYSWDYHGHDYLKAMEDAKKEAEIKLNEYIDQRIQLALSGIRLED